MNGIQKQQKARINMGYRGCQPNDLSKCLLCHTEGVKLVAIAFIYVGATLN